VSLGTLAAGKVALRALLLVGIVVSFSVLALLVAGVSVSAPGAVARLALWLSAVGAYGALWFALAVLVASFGRSSAANATMLATLWLLLVVMLPSLFNLLATTLYPVPSRVEMIQAVRVASDEAAGAGSTLLARYYEDHPELASGGAEQAMNDFNIIRVAVDDDVARRARPVVDRYEQQLARQQQMIDRLRYFSPAVLMQDALNDVSGTGSPRHKHFLEQVDRFHAQWRGFIVPQIFQKARITDAATAPRFDYEEERTAAVARRVLAGFFGLLTPAVVMAWVGLRRLRAYPVVA
jgi:ABC-2 type transport system permease protein